MRLDTGWEPLEAFCTPPEEDEESRYVLTFTEVDFLGVLKDIEKRNGRSL